MKKRIIRICALLILFVLPFGAIAVMGHGSADIYADSYSAALCDKYEALESCTEKKVILVGGSSLPFGVRSDILEEKLGRKVINLGVYAAFGTAPMLEIAERFAHDGDIVVLAPELSAETYSMHFGADVMWEAAILKPGIIRCFSGSEKKAMYAACLPFLMETVSVSRRGTASDSLYNRKNFNSYGDFIAERPCNIMAGGYDRTQPITLDGIAGGDFLDFVRAANEKIAGRGAFLLFTFSPGNLDAVEFDEDESDGFVRMLGEKLGCDIIGSPWDFSYGSKYFYNTNYHLNDAGAVLHTVKLLQALKDHGFGKSDASDIEIPEPGENTGDDGPADDTYSEMFEYEETGGTLYLSGVKEEYRTSTVLTLPVSVGGRRIIGISAGAFSGCPSLATLTIPDGYAIFGSGIFEGCRTLERINLLVKDPGRTTVPLSGLFEGTSDRLRVHLLPEAYPSFISNYSWRIYKSYFTVDGEIK